MTAGRAPDSGVVLINVLVILALMASVVFAMVSLSDVSITRSQRYSEAGQALELIAAGEASAIVALRRDMVEAPETDNLAEGWAQIQQEEVAIAAGLFSLSIMDAQSKLNLNSLPGTGAGGAQLLRRTLESLELPADIAFRIGARLAQREPLLRLDDLRGDVGLSDAQLERMAELIAVLPGRTNINVNTAPEKLLAALADNPVQARNLIGIRNRKGFLTNQDLIAARMILPSGAGFVSEFFYVTTTVRVGETELTHKSLLQRRRGQSRTAEVVVISRDMQN